MSFFQLLVMAPDTWGNGKTVNYDWKKLVFFFLCIITFVREIILRILITIFNSPLLLLVKIIMQKHVIFVDIFKLTWQRSPARPMSCCHRNEQHDSLCPGDACAALWSQWLGLMFWIDSNKWNHYHNKFRTYQAIYGTHNMFVFLCLYV